MSANRHDMYSDNSERNELNEGNIKNFSTFGFIGPKDALRLEFPRLSQIDLEQVTGPTKAK